MKAINDGRTVGSASPWRRFWERGGWWRAVLLAAAYYVAFQLVSIGLGMILGENAGDPGTAQNVLLTVGLPIAIGSVILVVFAFSVGWLPELFGSQPISGAWWMWIAVVAVLLFNVLRFASVDYAAGGVGFAAAWLCTGLFVGFAEEVLTRGFVVNLMRKAGHGEWAVMMVSATVFSAIHAGNLLSGQPLLATLIQLVYTFAFGVCMYLTLRVTGNLIWPILLHASTDPSISILSLYPSDSPLVGIAGLGNFAVIVTGLGLLFLVRGRVGPSTRQIRGDTPPKGLKM